MQLQFDTNDTTNESMYFDGNTIIAKNPKSDTSEKLYIHMYQHYKKSPTKSNHKYKLTQQDYRNTMWNFINDYKKLKNKSFQFINTWGQEFKLYNMYKDSEEESDDEELIDQENDEEY